MAFSFTPQQQQQLFQPQFQQPSPFQQSNPLFQPQPQQQQLPQQQQQQQQFFQQQQQQQQNQLYLFTNDKTPATYGTKWSDLHPDSQKLLLQIEERILENRDESQRLDQCGRLYDSSVSHEGFELDASLIVQELTGISTSMDRQKALLHELMAVAKGMLRNTEIAVRSFMLVRPRFPHPNKTTSTNAIVTFQASGTAANTTGQRAATTIVPVYDFYSGQPRKPSPFLQQTVGRFEKYITECCQWIEELEQLLLLDSNKNPLGSNNSLLQSLPKVMSNVHDFFVHVAAKLESIHQYMRSMKTAYLADQRHRGDRNDPFLEADRRETAKQAAAARRVHPTLHIPANSQPSTQAATGLFTSSASTPSTSLIAAPPTAGALSSFSSGSAPNIFSAPFAAMSASSLFSTPTTSAPASSLFGLTGTPQTSFASSFPASTPLSSTPSLFGSTLPGASTFSTPFASGAATGSGASFGTLSKSRAKSRSGRR